MRFLSYGPSIPDELLMARDEGRTVFFCGSGVSIAKAGLTDFFGLAESVLNYLGVQHDSPARKLITNTVKFEEDIGMSGIVSADKVFGILERDFLRRDIEEAVARSLEPDDNVDLSAHKTMLDLATLADGKSRLVTTNFDILFEACNNNLPFSSPPRLPDPLNYEEFEGIIHLHGRVNDNYKSANSGGFVLSPSEFGRAYLSDGWATAFIKSVLSKYIVVFVGYTADDPPVQYLLEALHNSPEFTGRAYAFQSGAADEAEAKWRHKGVHPIAYDADKGHKALWDTMTEWAGRARNPSEWIEKTIISVRQGPEELMPYQRGQVAHIVSTLEGVRRFTMADPPPTAEWLCVFDPTIRFGTPSNVLNLQEDDSYFDPFIAYAIDSDPKPEKMDPEDYIATRKIPKEAWNCFDTNKMDQKHRRDGNFSGLTGHWSTNIGNLPTRLEQLSVWIAKVSNQPASIWWGSMQNGLHPSLQRQIQYQLYSKQIECDPDLRQTWRLIFKAKTQSGRDINDEWFKLKNVIKLDGWDESKILDYSRILRPYITVDKTIYGGYRPPSNNKELQKSELARFNLELPLLSDILEIPDDLVELFLRELRKNLEIAVALDSEIKGHIFNQLSPIDETPDPDDDSNSKVVSDRATQYLSFFVSHYKRLVNINPHAAKREYSGWSLQDESVFARLRIWIAGDRRIVTHSEAGKIISSLSNKSFWGRYHQRDLLIALSKRWNHFSITVKKKIERKLLKGRNRFRNESKEQYENNRAWWSLTRIQWLLNKGCELTFDWSVEKKILQKFAPEWQPEYTNSATRSLQGRFGSVETDTEFSELLREPFETFFEKAVSISGREKQEFIERDPFAGMAVEKPDHAFRALTYADGHNNTPAWAWETFLNSKGRKNDDKELILHIATHLPTLPKEILSKISYSVVCWILEALEIHIDLYFELVERLWNKLIKAIKTKPKDAQSRLVRNKSKPDWTTEAINSPIGKIVQVLLKNPKLKDLANNEGLPCCWQKRADELLSMEGDLARHAIVMFSHNLVWLHIKDPDWTSEYLISKSNSEGDDHDAFWDGFFWGAKQPDPALYEKLKPHFLKFAKRGYEDIRFGDEVLPALMLAGWGTIDPDSERNYIDDSEIREVLTDTDDGFRIITISILKRWSIANEANWLDKLPIFLKSVWPRHKKVKSSTITSCLCDLALSNIKIFEIIIDTILTLVDVIQEEYPRLYNLSDGANGIVNRYPDEILTLLDKILSENVAFWPFHVEEILVDIGNANSALLNDSRLIELKRRWNSR